MTPHWIQTYTGKAFDVGVPTADMVCLDDIAHSLASQCRFTGHINTFYSVAEHSIMVATHVHKSLAIYALLHDAHEAYIGDLASPIKPLIPEWRALENRIDAAIYAHFGLDPLPQIDAEVIKIADLRMCMTEANQLLGPPPQPWELQVEPYHYHTADFPFGLPITSWATIYSRSVELALEYHRAERSEVLAEIAKD